MLNNLYGLPMQSPKRALHDGALILCAALCILGLGLPANARAKFKKTDPPGSASTYATSINDSGAITGFYSNARNGYRYHGFVRTH